MQVSRPIKFYLPEKLVIELENRIKSNPPYWRHDMNLFYYLIHRLVVMRIHLKDKEEEYFPLPTNNLKYVSTWNLNRYKKYLLNGEFLQCDNIAITGSKRYHYRINPNYLQGSQSIEIPTSSELYKSIIHRQRLSRSHSHRLPPYLRRMLDFYLGLDMDYSGAKKYAESHPDEAKRHSYLTSIAMIEDKRFRRFSRNKTNNRLDTNFTNLKSDFRRFLIGDFVSIDLKNSQPFLISQLLGEIFTTITTNTIPPVYSCSVLGLDVVQWFGKQTFNYLSKIRQNVTFHGFGELLKFQISCINGLFYEDFLERFSGKDITRDQIKMMMFAVLFSQNAVYKKYSRFVPYKMEKEFFASIYPAIYNAIELLKQKDHTRIAILLQKLEAKVFIDILCPELVANGIIPLTIHDSIIVLEDQVDEALRICRSVFKELFDVIPTFKVERLKPSSDDESSK